MLFPYYYLFPSSFTFGSIINTFIKFEIKTLTADVVNNLTKH